MIGTIKVEEVEIESESRLLRRMDSKIIYEYNSMSLISSLLDMRDSLLTMMTRNAYTFAFAYFGSIFVLFLLGFVVSHFIENSLLSSFMIGFIFVSLAIVFDLCLTAVSGWNSYHPKYYIIGENKIVEVPESQPMPDSVIYFDSLEDFEIMDGEIIFSSSDETIKFSLPDEQDFVRIQDEIYKMKD